MEQRVLWLLLIGVLMLFAYVYYLAITAEKFDKEFSARIINKYTTTQERQTGSTFIRYLDVEEKTGKRINLKVSEAIFQTAEPGLWIEVSKSGMRVYRPQNEIRGA